MIAPQNRPSGFSRSSELRRWVDSGAYTAILGGDYPRREDDDSASMAGAAAEAAQSYSEAFKDTGDALGRFAGVNAADGRRGRPVRDTALCGPLEVGAEAGRHARAEHGRELL